MLTLESQRFEEDEIDKETYFEFIEKASKIYKMSKGKTKDSEMKSII